MSDPTLFDGESLRDAGMALVDFVERPSWQERCDLAIKYLAMDGGEFTSEDVRRIVGDPEHYNSFGARFLKASRAGLIVCVGRRKAERPSLHAHEIRVWKGAAA